MSEEYFDKINKYLEHELKKCQERIHSNPNADHQKYRERGYEKGLMEAMKFVGWIKNEYIDNTRCSHCDREY